MARAYCVDAHLAELCQLPFYRRPVHGGAQRPEIVVHTAAVELYLSAVEEEAAVGGHFHAAEAEIHGATIYKLPIAAKRYPTAVQLRVGDVPQSGVTYFERLSCHGVMSALAYNYGREGASVGGGAAVCPFCGGFKFVASAFAYLGL